jgi:hypothetical protein
MQICSKSCIIYKLWIWYKCKARPKLFKNTVDPSRFVLDENSDITRRVTNIFKKKSSGKYVKFKKVKAAMKRKYSI